MTHPDPLLEGDLRVLAPDDDAVDLYERAPCGYLSTTLDGRIVRINQTLLEWLGRTTEELLGTMFVELLTAGGRIYHETHWRPMLTLHGSAREIALDLRRADGSTLPVLVNARVVETTSGERLVRTSVLDATQRREYERELLRARERAEASEARAMELARTLQASLIPPKVPTVPGVEVGASYRPAGDGAQVGGDFYDVFEAADGDWVVVVGDVRGKGVGAATVTALSRYAIRAAAMRDALPSAILRELNTVLLHDATERFVTAVCMRVQVVGEERVRLTVASGGHPPALRTGPSRVVPLSARGTLLGVVEEPVLVDELVELRPGEGLLCYTDGLTEARRGREVLGVEGLADVLWTHRELPSVDLTEAVVEDVLAYQGARPRDDIAVVHLRVPPPLPGGEPPPSGEA